MNRPIGYIALTDMPPRMDHSIAAVFLCKSKKLKKLNKFLKKINLYIDFINSASYNADRK